MKKLGPLLLVAFLIASSGLGLWLMTHRPGSPLAAAVLLGPMTIVSSFWLAGRGGWPSKLAAFALVAGFGSVVWAVDQGRLGTQGLYVTQHALIHAALGLWFARSLNPGPALIVQVARRVHALTPDMERYATQVTRAWAIYFFAMVVVSLTLAWLAPFDTWAFFANVLTPVSAVTMFVGEHWLRYRLHPEFERVSMKRAIDAYRRQG